MRKQIVRLIVILLLLSMMASVYAQETGDVPDSFTFESGVSFTVPAQGTLDLERATPRVVIDNPDGVFVLIDMFDPTALENLFGVDTATLTLSNALELVAAALDTAVPAPEEITRLTTADGRQGLSFVIYVTSDELEIIDRFTLLNMSDGRIGLANIRSTQPLTDSDFEQIQAVLDSFDTPPTFAGELYTLVDGAFITLPDGGVMDTSQLVPAIVFDDPSIRVEVAGHWILDPAIGDTRQLPLADVMEFLLGLSNYSAEVRAPEDVPVQGTTVDGREMLSLEFASPSDNLPQLAFVIRMSDGSIGALNAMPAEPLNDATRALMFALASTLDVSFNANTATPESVGLTEVYEYATGSSFRYPPEFVVDEELDAPFVSLILPETLVLTMLDPVLLGFTPETTLAEVTQLSVANLSIETGDIRTTDALGRQIYYGVSVEGDQQIITIIYVPFDNGYIGVVEGLSLAPLPDDLFATVLNIAASFNATGQ